MRPVTSYDWLDALLKRVAERGREMARKARANGAGAAIPNHPTDAVEDLLTTCEDLLSESGEARGTALAEEVVDHFAEFDRDQRRRFFLALANRFGPDKDLVSSC